MRGGVCRGGVTLGSRCCWGWWCLQGCTRVSTERDGEWERRLLGVSGFTGVHTAVASLLELWQLEGNVLEAYSYDGAETPAARLLQQRGFSEGPGCALEAAVGPQFRRQQGWGEQEHKVWGTSALKRAMHAAPPLTSPARAGHARLTTRFLPRVRTLFSVV